MSRTYPAIVPSPNRVLRGAVCAVAALGLAPAALAQGTCATGAAPLQTVVSGCYPTDCVSLADLDFGPTGVPASVDVPKFDPALGTLLEVRVRASFDYRGNLTLDNNSTSCGFVMATAALIYAAQPAASNVPPVTGLPPIQGSDQFDLLALDFQLGSTDGVNDCATPSGPQSIGDCTPGEDHALRAWDLTYAEPEVLVPSSGLDAWIAGAPGDAVMFDVTAVATVTITSPGFMNICFDTRGSARVDVTYVYCPALAQVTCDCVSASPCGNVGQGGAGCANSTGRGARLDAGGTASLAAADLVLTGSLLPPNRPGVFLSGAGSVPVGAATVLDGGLLCTTAPLQRLEVVFADANGDCASSVDLGAASGGVAGLPGHFQLWYRDVASAPCGGGSNLTNGLAILWAP